MKNFKKKKSLLKREVYLDGKDDVHFDGKL
jgi:hypothetical protein